VAKRLEFDLWCAELLVEALPKYIKQYSKRENIKVKIREIYQEDRVVHVKVKKKFSIHRKPKSGHRRSTGRNYTSSHTSSLGWTAWGCGDYGGYSGGGGDCGGFSGGGGDCGGF
jgi:hypothetical protein